MKDLRKNISHMFVLLALLFVIMGGYLVYVAAFESEEFISNPFNARVNIDDDGIKRGTIYDRHGVVIAESVFQAQAQGGIYMRSYPLGPLFAHTAGYSGMSRAGLELSRNFTMYRLNWELIQRARNAIFGDGLAANSIVTTFDAELQRMIFDALGGSRGAAVVLNPTSGAVLAMVSTPSFDPNYVTENWSALINDSANSPLLNRASQGLYPPGSTFKIVTAIAALSYDPNLLDFVFECTGQHVFGSEIIRCFNGVAHGSIDMHAAMAVSCNGYFAVIAEMIGAEPLIQAANQVMLNIAIPFELAASSSQFPMGSEPSIAELIQTSIGQGRITATPLNMAVIAAAIANGGIVMEPYMVERVVGAYGGTVSSATPRSIGRIMDAETAALLDEMLIEAVNTGTGIPAGLRDFQTAGKTGTAQNETGIDHSWFIGYAPAENPQVALAVIIENTGGGQRASQLAGQIFGFAVRDE